MSYPNTQTCYLCHREIEQDDDSRLWFDASLPWKPTWRSDWLDSFETQQGWCCSTTCFNDHAIEAEESSTRIHLVGGAA